MKRCALGLAIVLGLMYMVSAAGAENLLVVMPGYTVNQDFPLYLASIELTVNGTKITVVNNGGSTCFRDAFPASLTGVNIQMGSSVWGVSDLKFIGLPAAIPPDSVSIDAQVAVTYWGPMKFQGVILVPVSFRVSSSAKWTPGCNGRPAYGLEIK